MAIITLSPSKTYTDNSILIINYNIPNTAEWQTRLQEAQNYDGVIYINLGTSTLTFKSVSISELPASGSFTYGLGEASAISQANIYVDISFDNIMGADTSIDYSEQAVTIYGAIESERPQYTFVKPHIYLNNQLIPGVFYQYINSTWKQVATHIYMTPAVNHNALGRVTLGSLVLK